MMRRLLWISLLVLGSACSHPDGPPVVADNVVVTAPAAGMPVAAGYLDISNHSGATVRITRVTSPDYESVELHETTIEDGVARMRAVPVLEIADGATVSLARGGRHLMLMRPVGTPDIITLNFYSQDQLLLTVTAQFTAIPD